MESTAAWQKRRKCAKSPCSTCCACESYQTTPVPTPSPTNFPTEAPTAAPSDSPTPATSQPDDGAIVERHGHLSVQGNRIVDENGQPVHLRGMSLFWSMWMPQYYKAEVVQWLVDDWNITIIRAAMGIEHTGGYVENPDGNLQMVETVVDAAIAAGIYVIIDWHDHYAENHLSESKAFFAAMAEKYGSYANVIYEVFNEPVGQDWSSVIKPYHEEVVSTIRGHTSNLVILGTRTWSQRVDEASLDPVEGVNLAYTIHFYAGTSAHQQPLRNVVTTALNNGIALFATEWGTCESSGDGQYNFDETQIWLDFLQENSISDANWAVSDKDEACSALLPGASGSGSWSLNDLTESGLFLRASLRGEAMQATPDSSSGPMGCATNEENCQTTLCCQDPSRNCYEKDHTWASCREGCTPGIYEFDPPEHQTPWSCELLGR